MTMLIRCRLRGTGADADPYHVDLPTYTMLDVDYAALTALVEVPDDALPLAIRSPAPADRIDTPHGPARVRVSPAAAREWHDHLDDRYREHAGEFRPEVG